MSTYNSPVFYSQLQSTYDLDQAFGRCSTSQNSQVNTPIIENSQQEKRSTKNHVHPKIETELSFDKELLKQHLKVMEKYLPVFSRISEGNKHRKHPVSGLNLSPWVNGITQSDSNPANMGNYYSAQSWQVPDIYSQIPIQGHEDLSEFVRKCKAKVDKSTRSPFLAITNMMWSKFCQAGELLKEVGSIINYSQQILENLLNEAILVLGLHNLDLRQIDELTQFLQVYFITFVLVANQYFQNPYFEEETPRSIEEDSDFDFFEDMEQRNWKNPRKIVHQVTKYSDDVI